MDFAIILSTLVSFLKLLLLIGVFSFIGYKVFSPLRKKLEEKYSLSWVNSCLATNFVITFVFLIICFIYFMFVGYSLAPLRDPYIEYDLIDNLIFILLGAIRIAIACVILSLALLFFEMVASFFMLKDNKSSRGGKQGKVPLLRQIWGILISSALFIILFLFVFNWAALGLFIFIFYGSINPLPLLMVLL